LTTQLSLLGFKPNKSQLLQSATLPPTAAAVRIRQSAIVLRYNTVLWQAARRHASDA